MSANAADIKIAASGAGKPVVHLRTKGAPADAAALSRHFQMLSIELPGANGARGEALARDIAGAVASHGAKTFSVVGQADGARLALWLAVIAPEAVEGIVLAAPTLLNAAGEASDAQLAARLGDVKVPVLALFGTTDAAAPPERGRLYKHRLANCHLVFVYDAGHNIETERPAAAAAVMRDFLERRDQFIVNAQSGRLYP